MTSGPRTGAHFVLDPSRQTRIGRGLECDVVLSDPLSSRIHAIITCEDGLWWLRDAGSRNGTFLMDQRIDEARLVASSELKVGSTEFLFLEAELRPSDSSLVEHAATILHDRVVLGGDTGNIGVAALSNAERAHDFLALHQLSIQLLGCSDPDEVVRAAL